METLYSGIFVFGLFTHPYQFNDRTGGSAPVVTTWTHPVRSRNWYFGRVQTKHQELGDWTIKGLDLSLPLLPRILQNQAMPPFLPVRHTLVGWYSAGNPKFGLRCEYCGIWWRWPGFLSREIQYWRPGEVRTIINGMFPVWKPINQRILSWARQSLEMKKAITKACKKKRPFSHVSLCSTCTVWSGRRFRIIIHNSKGTLPLPIWLKVWTNPWAIWLPFGKGRCGWGNPDYFLFRQWQSFMEYRFGIRKDRVLRVVYGSP